MSRKLLSGRRVKGRTYTLRQNQIDYLDDRCADGYSRSRWIREAVDMKMKQEILEMQKIVKRSVNAIVAGRSGNLEAKLGALDAAQTQAISDFRASIQHELAQGFLDTAGELHSEEGSES